VELAATVEILKAELVELGERLAAVEADVADPEPPPPRWPGDPWSRRLCWSRRP
jgi:hypothetical protein